ncbi:MAG TPA: hypothetical protein VFU05_13995, partial [Cyclobacteriaceae bacterium]|nr:hypothetical protein [Cyclobacteriaceae bacterium]
KVLGFYAIMSVAFSLAQIASVIFFSYAGLNEIGNASVLLELLLFTVFFFYSTNSLRFRKILVVSAVIYGSFYIIVFLFFGERAYSFIRFGRDSLMLFYALMYFYYLIVKIPEENLLTSPTFWINSAIIFFFSGTFVLSLFRDYIVTVLKNDTAGFLAFRNFFRFAFCLVVSYAGWIDLQLLLKQSRKSI